MLLLLADRPLIAQPKVALGSVCHFPVSAEKWSKLPVRFKRWP